MGTLVIEGLPAAGKSTVAGLLEKKDYKVLYEVGRVVPIEKMPGNGKTLEEILKIDDWFIAQEAKRSEKSKNSIMDRYFFTHLTYSYAYSNFIKINAFKETLKKYQKAIQKNLLKLPDALVFIEISSETSILRQKQMYKTNPEFKDYKKRLPDFWRNRHFLNDLTLAYSKLFLCLKNIDIFQIDGEKEIENIAFDIEKIYLSITSKDSKMLDFDKFYLFLGSK